MFTHVSVILLTGGHVWQVGMHGRRSMCGRGACMAGTCMAGGMHGKGVQVREGVCMAGACMVGGMCGRGVCGGVCVAGGMHGRCVCYRGNAWQGCAWWGGHAWQERWPLQWMVCILLECILVYICRLMKSNVTNTELGYPLHGSTVNVQCTMPLPSPHKFGHIFTVCNVNVLEFRAIMSSVTLVQVGTALRGEYQNHQKWLLQ